MTTAFVLLVVAAVFALSLAALLRTQKNWLNLAQTERWLAETWHTIGDHDKAAEREALADLYERRAWPFKPQEKEEL